MTGSTASPTTKGCFDQRIELAKIDGWPRSTFGLTQAALACGMEMQRIAMNARLACGALALLIGAGAAGAEPPPLYNPAVLNIGFICQWQDRCMDRQRVAMKRALRYVAKYRPPAWKIELCNRNASRVRVRGDWKRGRVDWVGFDRCIRNPTLHQTMRLSRR
jgi:hypothetical protein